MSLTNRDTARNGVISGWRGRRRVPLHSSANLILLEMGFDVPVGHLTRLETCITFMGDYNNK
jgi:hypothetical protein